MRAALRAAKDSHIRAFKHGIQIEGRYNINNRTSDSASIGLTLIFLWQDSEWNPLGICYKIVIW